MRQRSIHDPPPVTATCIRSWLGELVRQRSIHDPPPVTATCIRSWLGELVRQRSIHDPPPVTATCIRSWLGELVRQRSIHDPPPVTATCIRSWLGELVRQRSIHDPPPVTATCIRSWLGELVRQRSIHDPPWIDSSYAGWPKEVEMLTDTELLLEKVPQVCLDDALVRAGADALALFPGVWRVAVFGSVARETSSPYSDIDYLVLCDEIDYEKRNKLAFEMQEAALVATGWFGVDVVVSDTAEWAARASLASTFEANIEAEAVDLIRRAQPIPTSTRKQKITMANASENATASLTKMATSLAMIRRSSLSEDYENDAVAAGDKDLVDQCLADRWMHTPQAAEMAIEHGVGALRHVTGSPSVVRHRFHELAALRDVLSDERIRGEVAKILAPLRVAELPVDAPFEKGQLEFTKFRVVADYGAATAHDDFVDAARVMAYMKAVVDLGQIGLAETLKLAPSPVTAEVDKQSLARFATNLESLSRFVDGYDPLAGRSGNFHATEPES